MYCKNCGKELNEGAAVCLSCGVQVGTGLSYCMKCGARLESGQAYCLSCGVAADFGVSRTSGVSSDGKIGGQDKSVLILLAIFLGGFGVHNFMLGENKKAVAKILLSCLAGIGWVVALYDVYKLAVDKYEIDPEAWF